VIKRQQNRKNSVMNDNLANSNYRIDSNI